MTIEQANQYFASLPEGFASTEQLQAALPAAAQKVQYVGISGTAGKTTVAALLAATLRAAGIHAGWYHAGCEPLAARIHVDGAPVDETLLCLAAEALSAAQPLPQEAAELAVLHSSQNGGAKVAVDTTEVKNIWKANGAKPGMVLYEVYTTVYVTPRSGLEEQLKKK